jgi:hypothetical protein
MKIVLVLGALAASLLFLSGASVSAQDVNLNNGFELQDTTYWKKTGGLGASYWGNEKFDTNNNGTTTWAFWQSPYSGKNGGLSQTIFVIAGVTYELTVDIAYYNC